ARLNLDVIAQRLGQRPEITLDMLAPADAGVIRGKRVIPIGRQNRLAPERRDVHAEWAEQLDVSPAPDMLADSTLFINGDRHFQLPRIHPRFQADGAGAEYGNARRDGLTHGVPPRSC